MDESPVPRARPGALTGDALECVPVERLAALVGVSKSQLYALARQGKVPHVRLGANVVFPRRQWERWFEKMACVEGDELARVNSLEAGVDRVVMVVGEDKRRAGSWQTMCTSNGVGANGVTRSGVSYAV